MPAPLIELIDISRPASGMLAQPCARSKENHTSNAICFSLAQMYSLTQPNDAHLERPHPSDPHFERPVYPFDVVQLDAFPPATTSGLSPEEEKFLCHAYGVTAHLIAADVAAKPGEGQAADYRFVGFTGAMTPAVIVIEAALFPC